MRYIWNDFALKHNRALKSNEQAIPQWTPCGTFKFDGRIIKPGESFESEPDQIKKLGPEIAAKCMPEEEFKRMRGLAALPEGKPPKHGGNK